MKKEFTSELDLQAFEVKEIEVKGRGIEESGNKKSVKGKKGKLEMKRKKEWEVISKEGDELLGAPMLGDYDYDVNKAQEYTRLTLLEQEKEEELKEAKRVEVLKNDMAKTVEEYNDSVDKDKSSRDKMAVELKEIACRRKRISIESNEAVRKHILSQQQAKLEMEVDQIAQVNEELEVLEVIEMIKKEEQRELLYIKQPPVSEPIKDPDKALLNEFKMTIGDKIQNNTYPFNIEPTELKEWTQNYKRILAVVKPHAEALERAFTQRTHTEDLVEDISRQRTEISNDQTMYVWSNITKADNRRVLSYIDGGAATSLCTRSFISSFEYNTTEVKDFTSWGLAVGGALIPLGTQAEFVVEIEAQYGGKSYMIPLLLRCRVVEDDHFTAPLLIGASDLGQIAVKVNMMEKCLEFHSSGNRVLITKGLSPQVVTAAQTIGNDFTQAWTQLAVNLTTSLKVAQEAHKVWEEGEFKTWEANCDNLNQELRPIEFPHKYWRYLPLGVKKKVKEVYAKFSSERLAVIVPKVEKIDISDEDKSRKEESPYVRALCYARLDAFFMENEENLKHVPGYEFKLDVIGSQELKCIPRGFSAEERAFLHAKTNKMLKQGRLIKRMGPHMNGLVLVPYPERMLAFYAKYPKDGEAQMAMLDPENEEEISQWFRLTGDFRNLNRRIKLDKFPLPRIEMLLGAKPSGRWSTGDVEDAFFCVKVAEESQPWTGFNTHEGHFEYISMPQGISTAPMVWAQVVDDTFNIDELKSLAMFWYQDDVFVHDDSFGGHCQILLKVFDRMVEKGLTFKVSKTHLNFRSMKVLGHIMCRAGKLPDPELVRAVNDWSIPIDQGEVRSLVGLVVYVKSYIKDMAHIMEPLLELMKKGVNVAAEWDERHNEAFRALKKALTCSPVLRPIDVSKKFRIHVDACRRGRGIGAVLLQQHPDDDDKWHPVAFWSLKLTNAEREYSATDLECKAMHDTIQHWSPYLRNGIPFEVVTDHYALVYLVTKPVKDSNGRLMRYIMNLQQYPFSTIHRRGKDHLDADAMSRLFRYDDSELRILMAADLVERGPVTVKDEADLEAYFSIILADPGIRRATVEARLDNIQPAKKMHDKQTTELMDRITLRHELEKAAGMLYEDDVEWVRNDSEPGPDWDTYIDLPKPKDVNVPVGLVDHRPVPITEQPLDKKAIYDLGLTLMATKEDEIDQLKSMYNQGAISLMELNLKTKAIVGTGKTISLLSVAMRKEKQEVRFKPSVRCKIMLIPDEVPNAISEKADMVLDLQPEAGEYSADLKYDETRSTREKWRKREIEFMQKEAKRQLEIELADSMLMRGNDEKAFDYSKSTVKSEEFASYSCAEQLEPKMRLLEYIRKREAIGGAEPIMLMAQVLPTSMVGRVVEKGPKKYSRRQPLVTVPFMGVVPSKAEESEILLELSDSETEAEIELAEGMEFEEKPRRGRPKKNAMEVMESATRVLRKTSTRDNTVENSKSTKASTEARETGLNRKTTRASAKLLVEVLENRAKEAASAITNPITTEDLIYLEQYITADDVHHDDLVTPEVELEEARLQYLVDKVYVDEENGREYRIASVFFDKTSGLICAYRVPNNGRPPDDGDNDSFVVNEGEYSIVKLVEQYELAHPDAEPRFIVSMEELRTEQLKDEHTARIMRAYETSDPNYTFVEQSKIKFMSVQEKHLKEPTLYYVYMNRKPNERVLWKQTRVIIETQECKYSRKYFSIILPEIYRDSVLKEYHQMRGHPGSGRMLRTLKMSYTWKGMAEDVKRYAHGCKHCQLRKAGNAVRNPPLQCFPAVDTPFQRCHVDLFGPLVSSKRGNTYVVVFKDALTKWIELFAIQDGSAESVAECMVDEIFMRHGSPEVVVSDRGTAFVNKTLKQVCSLLKIRKITTAPYNPRADGLAENAVRTVKDMLSAYTNVLGDDWDDYLAIVAHHYRTTVNDATGKTPFSMMYGRECRTPDMLWVQQFSGLPDLTEYSQDLAWSMETMWELIGEKERVNSHILSEKSKVGNKFKEFQVGDEVGVVRIPSRFFNSEEAGKVKIRKALQDRYSGPYRIVRKVSPITYVVNIFGKESYIAARNMKKFSGG